MRPHGGGHESHSAIEQSGAPGTIVAGRQVVVMRKARASGQMLKVALGSATLGSMDRDLQEIIERIRASQAKAKSLKAETKQLLHQLDEAVARVEEAEALATRLAEENSPRRRRKRD